MDYQEAFRYITELQNKIGSDYSLGPVRRLCELAGSPDRGLTIIHIAGTNGKGSIGSYLSSILVQSGYTVGRYLSPTLLEYRERIQWIQPGLAPEYITECEVAEHLTYLRSLATQMEAQEDMAPTAFEIETVMAFLAMKQWKVDVAILECGMGGRTDATNIILSPVLCLFSKIGYDHTAFLGETLEEITEEKAGIIKQGSQVVSVKQDRSVDAVMRRHCREKGIFLHIADPQEAEQIHYDMRGTTFCYHGLEWKLGQQGSYQIENTITAIEAAYVLQKTGLDRICESAVQAGISSSRLRGRFECVSEDPYVIVDGAHNPPAAVELRHCLELYFPGEKFTYICGVFRDKDYLRMMEEMLPFAARIFTVTPPGARGLRAEELAESVKNIWEKKHLEESEEKDVAGKRLAENRRKAVGVQCPAKPCRTVAEALDLAVQEPEKILVFGSLSFLHEVYEYFGEGKLTGD